VYGAAVAPCPTTEEYAAQLPNRAEPIRALLDERLAPIYLELSF
jgi:hypothetical protein